MGANGKTHAQIASLPRLQPGRRGSIRQVLSLQAATFRAGLALDDALAKATSTDDKVRIATALAKVGATWEKLQDAKRIVRGKPLPSAATIKRDAERRARQKPRSEAPPAVEE